MSINSVDDIVKTLLILKNDSNLKDYIDDSEDDDYLVINPNYIEDDKLRENVDEIELSASYYFLDLNGMVNKNAEAKLVKNGFKVNRLPENYHPQSHSINSPEFNIFFSCY